MPLTNAGWVSVAAGQGSKATIGASQRPCKGTTDDWPLTVPTPPAPGMVCVANRPTEVVTNGARDRKAALPVPLPAQLAWASFTGFAGSRHSSTGVPSTLQATLTSSSQAGVAAFLSAT